MGKNLSHWAVQICQYQGSISTPRSRKYTITFCIIWAAFARKQGSVTNQSFKIKIWQNFVNLQNHFGSNIFQFCSYRLKRTFQKNFNLIFKFGCFYWYHAYISYKKWIRLPDTKFNAESVGTNFKSQKWKSKTFVCSFLNALFHFETNLIK